MAAQRVKKIINFKTVNCSDDLSPLDKSPRPFSQTVGNN